ncbi:MAG: hypothetical protein WC829_06955 [Hyphomicrobium sp.]|jgi:hypothetical protein
MKRELEVALEARCVAKIEARGGLALKLAIPGVRGFPDRSCMLPGATLFFIETKRLKTGRLSAQQVRWKAVLWKLGYNVYVIDTDEQFDAALEKELAR